MALSGGSSLGTYEITREIGRGAMGIVYLARDTNLDRDVAIKCLPDELALDSDRLARFEREAKTLASLNHPNIATIYGMVERNGRRYLILEYVGGDTLEERLSQGKMSCAVAISIAKQIAEAIETAHRKNIIHRDLKPANIKFISENQDVDHIKVLDFGLAKVSAAPALSKEMAENSSTITAYPPATMSGVILGTPGYLSPEQARGVEVDERSDIFSFGCVLYKLLTGKPAFGGATVSDSIAALLDKEVDLDALPRNLPQSVHRLLHRCLVKDRNRRLQAIADARVELEEVMESLKVEEATTLDSSKPIHTLSDEQNVRFCTTADGMRLAYSVSGAGPMVVRVLGHFTHLEMEWEWPDLRHFWECLAEQNTIVRYDGRGMGLSDPYTGLFTEETRQLDLEAVLTAVGADKATLLGISEGGWTSATYAIHHTDRITHLILYGAYCRGARARPGYDPEEDRALMTLIRKGWGRDSPRFRQIFTSQFFREDADPRLIAHFNEMQRASADPDTAARYEESCHARGDGRDMFTRVSLPTLVIHCQDDLAVNAEEGRLLASIIPGARLVLLPSGTHYFPTDREVVAKVTRAISRFLHGSEGR